MADLNRSSRVETLFDLAGRTALVTGGASGGFATRAAEALAEAGAYVVVTSRTIGKAQSLAEQLQQQGLSVGADTLDLNDEDSIVAAVDRAAGQRGGLDILVNGASAICMDSVEKVRMDDFNRVLTANVSGTMAASRAAAPYIRDKGGAIISFSSIYGMVSPDPGIYGGSGLNSPLVYGASKAAIIQMTRYLAVHWAPTIRVNCITPGGLAAGQDEEFVSRYCAKTPLGRMGGPDDIKGIALYLASDASCWVTGQNFVIDGGWTAW